MGCVRQRSWDASNPHLNDLAGRQGIEPCWPVLETSLLPEDNPNLAESGEPESHAASGTVCFPYSPRTPPGSLSKLAEGGRSRSTHP